MLTKEYCCQQGLNRSIEKEKAKLQQVARQPLANDYDKILKENIATVFLPLAEKYLGVRIGRTEELKDKLQTTIEKEPDFIGVVETDGGGKFILQMEFQRVDEEGMIYRMQEYYGLLRRKYGLPVRQFVVQKIHPAAIGFGPVA